MKVAHNDFVFDVIQQRLNGFILCQKTDICKRKWDVLDAIHMQDNKKLEFHHVRELTFGEGE